VPFTKKFTDETSVPAGLLPIAVVALIVRDGGVPGRFCVLPVVGDVMEIVGVARASGAASRATRSAPRSLNRRKMVFMAGRA
jgi:hypothetical protein